MMFRRDLDAPFGPKPMKQVAILQSNYIPWKGYFDLLASVDEFILLDDMQYTRRDWRNRNKIKTPQGPQWISIPVKVKGKYYQTIRETEIDDTGWASAHWTLISRNYRRAPHFDDIAPVLEPIYSNATTTLLSEVNRKLIAAICQYLGITTTLRNSWDYDLKQGRNQRLVGLCQQAGASVYVSGPAAKDYLDEQSFRDHGISVVWFDYSSYPEYPQLWGDFVHEVTILDLLFNCGPDSWKYMKHVRSRSLESETS
jgi:hypothetical protein